MRMRISLFELLIVVTPTIAVALGLMMAALNAADPTFVLMLAESAFLLATLACVCLLFHRRLGVRVFAGAFVAASLGHLLLVFLASQSSYGGSFPTTYLLSMIWTQAKPEEAAAYSASYSTMGTPMFGSSWVGGSTLLPGMPGGYTGGGMGYIGNTIPIYQVPMPRPIFIEVGLWAISLVLGVLCGVVARSLRGDEKPEVREPKSEAAA